MKAGKAPEPSDVSTELVVASGQAGIHVVAELCQKVKRLGMPAE